MPIANRTKTMAPSTDSANTVWCPAEISASTSWAAWRV